MVPDRAAATPAGPLFATARGVDALRASVRRDPPRRIFVMVPSALGDAVMTTGAVRSIIARFPDAHLTIETSRRTMPLFDQFPGVDARRVRRDRFEKLTSTVWLRRTSFDLGILLDDSRRRAKVLRWGGVRRTAGVREGDHEAWLDASVCWHPDAHDRFDPLSAVLALLEADVDVRPCIYPSRDNRREAVRAFNELNPTPRVGLFVGASIEPKCWPIDRFIELSHRLQRIGFPVVAIAGLEANGMLDPLKAAGVPIAPAVTHPLVFAEFMRQLGAVVANDSGPAHLAAVAGVPTAVIYIATLPHRAAPYGDSTTLIHAGHDCDVYLKRCEGRRESGVCDRRCELSIGVDQVCDATVALLAGCGGRS